MFGVPIMRIILRSTLGFPYLGKLSYGANEKQMGTAISSTFFSFQASKASTMI